MTIRTVSITLLLALGSGCRGTGTAAAPASVVATRADGTGALAAFHAEEYDRAAQLTGGARERDESTLLLRGMSLAELGRHGEAQRALGPLTQSRDAGIRGRALATLGIAAQDRQDHRRAAQMLADASGALHGTDRVWAAHYAALSYRELGNTAAAAAMERIANPALTPAEYPADGAYAIQFGSFSTESRARRHQQTVTLITRRSGLPLPHVEPVQRGGRTLYAVRSGGFATADDARSAAGGLRTDTTIVSMH